MKKKDSGWINEDREVAGYEIFIKEKEKGGKKVNWNNKIRRFQHSQRKIGKKSFIIPFIRRGLSKW